MTPNPRRAIIAFTDTDAVSEDWTWFLFSLRRACRDTGVVVVSAGPGVDEVVVGPGPPVSVAPFRHRRRGYVFVQDDRAPQLESYDQVRVVLEHASEYFGLALRR